VDTSVVATSSSCLKERVSRLPWGTGIYSLICTRRQTQNHNHHDLLQVLLEAQDEHGNRMTDEQLRDEIVTMAMAGHEATANALSWTWYLLAQNPEKDDLLFAELRAVLGNRTPAMADLVRLPYTEMVIKECNSDQRRLAEL